MSSVHCEVIRLNAQSKMQSYPVTDAVVPDAIRFQSRRRRTRFDAIRFQSQLIRFDSIRVAVTVIRFGSIRFQSRRDVIRFDSRRVRFESGSIPSRNRMTPVRFDSSRTQSRCITGLWPVSWAMDCLERDI